MPYSVTTMSTMFREMETTAPGVSWGWILETVPFFAVEVRAMMLRPPLAWKAP